MSNITFGAGTLFFTDVKGTGGSFKLGEIKELDDINTMLDEIENKCEEEYVDTSSIMIKRPSSYAMTAEIKMDRQSMLSLIYGQKMTNNWLKMHGGVVTRRGRRGK